MRIQRNAGSGPSWVELVNQRVAADHEKWNRPAEHVFQFLPVETKVSMQLRFPRDATGEEFVRHYKADIVAVMDNGKGYLFRIEDKYLFEDDLVIPGESCHIREILSQPLVDDGYVASKKRYCVEVDGEYWDNIIDQRTSFVVARIHRRGPFLAQELVGLLNRASS